MQKRKSVAGRATARQLPAGRRSQLWIAPPELQESFALLHAMALASSFSVWMIAGRSYVFFIRLPLIPRGFATCSRLTVAYTKHRSLVDPARA